MDGQAGGQVDRHEVGRSESERLRDFVLTNLRPLAAKVGGWSSWLKKKEKENKRMTLS